jgi:hypothetical protein
MRLSSGGRKGVRGTGQSRRMKEISLRPSDLESLLQWVVEAWNLREVLRSNDASGYDKLMRWLEEAIYIGTLDAKPADKLVKPAKDAVT